MNRLVERIRCRIIRRSVPVQSILQNSQLSTRAAAYTNSTVREGDVRQALHTLASQIHQYSDGACRLDWEMQAERKDHQ
jgi:hypothetical protein